MTRILSSQDSQNVGRPGFKRLGNAVSKHSAEARRFVGKSTAGVTRLIARDPARAITLNEKADMFTDNPNMKVQPTGTGAQSASRVQVPKPPRGSTSGHQKVVTRAPKTWRRRRLS